MGILLTRDQFRESVFKRDGHKCVVCKEKDAVDAHHIMDRKLFEDGGYYLNNGASLCNDCHMKAEDGVITPTELRVACSIKEVVLPEDFDPNYTYDKWGRSSDEHFSRKYGRTYHYPFSPGTTSDDRISHHYWNSFRSIKTIVHTEKLDGENSCMSKLGVFARSHAAPTTHRWADHLKIKWSQIKNDLNDLEIFGENLYAIHSIKYKWLDDHFFVFGIRCKDVWLSWEETKFYANLLDFKTVPELLTIQPSDQRSYEDAVMNLVCKESVFGSMDAYTKKTCIMEGVVSRNIEEYPISHFKMNVLKYVRQNHVKTDEHWSKKPKRATLVNERPSGQDPSEDDDKIIK